MANNRTEFKTQVLNLIKAIVSISKHRQVLNDELADSLNFRKDVKSSTIVASSSANSIDFTSNDLVTIDGATNNLNLVLTITNTEDGEDSKYIRVLKDADKTVTFSGATDITTNKDIVTTLSEVIYQVYNKNGTIYANALIDSTPSSSLYPIIVNIGDWNMAADLSKVVTHGLSDFKKVREIGVMIRDDADSNYYYTPSVTILDAVNSAIGPLTSTTLSLTRSDGGIFNSTSFNSTSYNRGYITFWVIP